MFHRYRLNLILGAVALVLLSGSTPAAPPPDRDDIERLVIQLRAADFTERQAAEAALLAAGPRALPILEPTAEAASPESRYRLLRIISHLRKQQLEEALAVLETGGRVAPGQLPGWDRFAVEVGDDPSAARVFAGMVRAEPQMLGTIDTDNDGLKFEFERRCGELLQRRRKPMDAIPVETIAALMFVGTDSACLPSPAAAACVNSLLQSNGFEEAMQLDGPSAPLRTLTVRWVLRPESSTAVQRLGLAARYDLPEGVEVAREIIDSGIYGQQIRTAILFLAKHGRTNAIADLEALLDDETELRASTRNRNQTFTCLVRDVALAGLLYMTKQDPADYGFPELRENHEYVFVAQDIGFRDPATRDAAFERWRRWQARNLRKVQPLPVDAVEGIAL